jgi:hypothetical protein
MSAMGHEQTLQIKLPPLCLHQMKYDHAQLGSLSQRLATAIFAARPDLRQSASMERGAETDGLSVVISVTSPTNDEARSVVVWIDERATPSIGFGPTHTHEGSDDTGIAAILDTLVGVLTDQVVIVQDVGGDYPGFGKWLDLRIVDALEEELTDKYSPGRALLKSWSGRADRQVKL